MVNVSIDRLRGFAGRAGQEGKGGGIGGWQETCGPFGNLKARWKLQLPQQTIHSAILPFIPIIRRPRCDGHEAFLGSSRVSAHDSRDSACFQRFRRPTCVSTGAPLLTLFILGANCLPQYEVLFSNKFLTEHDADALLSRTGTRSTTASATPSSLESSDLSKLPKTSPIAAKHGIAVDETYEAVVLDGQRYLCRIPIVAPPEQNATATPDQAKDEEEKELMRATDRGWELLEGLQGTCIYYMSGWWSYSFCYKDQVKQFHQLPPGRGIPIFPPVEDTSVDSFVLGKFPKDKKGKSREEERRTLGGSDAVEDGTDQLLDEGKGLEVPRLESKGSTRYMVQSLSGGTECDLTRKERKIEVQVRSVYTVSFAAWNRITDGFENSSTAILSLQTRSV